jgi:hypothetical protein
MNRMLFGAMIAFVALPRIADAGPPTPAVLQVLPDDTGVVVAIDLKRARKSTAIAAVIEPGAGARAEKANAAMEALGIDPKRDVDRLVMASAGGGIVDRDKARMKILVVEGRFKIAPTAAATAKTHAGTTYWTVGDDTEIAFAGKRVFVTAAGEMPGLIDVIKGKAKNAAKGSKARMLRTAAAHARAKTAAGWAVVVLSAADKAKVKSQVDNVDWVTVTGATSAAGLALDVNLGTPSPATAQATVDKLSPQLDTARAQMKVANLGDMAQSLTLAAAESRIVLHADLTEAELTTLTTLVKALL